MLSQHCHVNGRPGGNRTPNLRFWRPPLCQLSYWPIRFQDAQAETPLTAVSACLFQTLRPGLLEDLGYYAGADGTAAFANRETQTFVHRKDRKSTRLNSSHV